MPLNVCPRHDLTVTCLRTPHCEDYSDISSPRAPGNNRNHLTSCYMEGGAKARSPFQTVQSSAEYRLQAGRRSSLHVGFSISTRSR
jgi:hypothetical protein